MNVLIIGEGNVGSHLCRAFRRSGIEAACISSRKLSDSLHSYNADIILLAVSDTAIPEVARQLGGVIHDFKGVVAHTAGSVGIDVLEANFLNYGVFYPLQTFSKEIRIPDYPSIPIFIEGNNSTSESALTALAKKAFKSVFQYPSDKRSRLHLASVFSCNFVNALYAIAQQILQDEDIPFDVLKPLITQTAGKVVANSPADCQTGPAVRGDEAVMKSHINALSPHPHLQNVYSILSDYITANLKK